LLDQGIDGLILKLVWEDVEWVCLGEVGASGGGGGDAGVKTVIILQVAPDMFSELLDLCALHTYKKNTECHNQILTYIYLPDLYMSHKYVELWENFFFNMAVSMSEMAD
jgi:hypothetical protein